MLGLVDGSLAFLYVMHRVATTTIYLTRLAYATVLIGAPSSGAVRLEISAKSKS
jgi:hypothetical protein